MPVSQNQDVLLSYRAFPSAAAGKVSWKSSNQKVARVDSKGNIHALEKEMATHSSVLAWRIPGMTEPAGLPSYGVAESDTTEVT